MKINEVLDLYYLIFAGSENIPSRMECIKLRKQGLKSLYSNTLVKVAFDTRRIDQETEYNPRRNLQNYNRSESFLSQALSDKLKNFAKLKNVLQDLKNKYGKEHEWQDSNARVLLSTLENGLRVGIEDGDYATSQPAQGSLDYIEELLHVRYRLGFDQLSSLGESDLKRVILSKDEELIHKDLNDVLISKSDVSNNSYDTLLNKLFDGVKASKENPEVERTITITIKDRIKE
jgi:hypothetical protein